MDHQYKVLDQIKLAHNSIEAVLEYLNMDCLIKKIKNKKTKALLFFISSGFAAMSLLVICIVDPKSELKTIFPIHHCHASS